MKPDLSRHALSCDAGNQQILKMAKDLGAESVDFRFTDTNGVWHHLTYLVDAVDAALLEDGVMFDGSSIPGWKVINDSDMLLKPRAEGACLDPFTDHASLIVFCDVWEPDSPTPYNRDPRSTAQRAEQYLIDTGIADTCNVGPEPEFFVFDKARYETMPSINYAALEGTELGDSHTPFSHEKSTADTSYRPLPKGGYFPVSPVDSAVELRFEMLDVLKKMGVPAEKGHHEVAPCQHELSFRYSTLVETGDNIQKYKYVVRNIAQLYDKTATFMPKPLYGDNGSGMHVHLSLAKNGVALFKGDQYGGLSQDALYFIGGILKHAQALNAFTNPSTNSYKRLIPGFEAPIYKAFSAKNRSAAIRIPHASNPDARRIEVRFPDPLANPYLATTALLMAGLDGIQNKIDPGKASNEDLYGISPKDYGRDNLLCATLGQALDALDKGRAFLLKGNVFTDDQIDAYIAVKEAEMMKVMQAPSPMEFKLYYSQ